MAHARRMGQTEMATRKKNTSGVTKTDGRILCIVESPNKKATISGIFKSLGYTNVTVMASVGHIGEIADGTGYYNTGIDVDHGFSPQFRVSSDKRDVVAKLRKAVSEADLIYLATDPDREGEAIAWSLREFLKIPESRYLRITFHEITKAAVQRALENPRKIDEDLVHASHARQKMDKMLGYRMSGISRANVGARSVGRCQSAGLELIVAREDEISSFVPEKYGELTATLEKNSQEFRAKYLGPDGIGDRKPTYAECVSARDAIRASLSSGGRFSVTAADTREARSNPKPPFTTSTFQQEVSARLGIGVEQAMQSAQRLFEGIEVCGSHVALITYIRTDDATLSPEFEKALGQYVADTYGKDYQAPVRKAKKSENAQAGHEAIRPVDLTMTPERLAGFVSDTRLLKVYGIIYRRTLACAMAASVTSETTYSLEQSGHRFSMVSRELLFDGYRRVYSDPDADAGDGPSRETLSVGELVDCTALEAAERQTTPPPRYREATFVRELERTGIGRPSTYASILKTLKDPARGYCTVTDRCLVPTDTGTRLARFLTDKFPRLINVEYTSHMESDLDGIAEGKVAEDDFLRGFLNTMEGNIASSGVTDTGATTGYTCPLCGAPMKFRKGPYGPFLGCTRYPQCKGIRKLAPKTNKKA